MEGVFKKNLSISLTMKKSGGVHFRKTIVAK